MPLDIPSPKDPKAKKAYLVVGGAAAAFVAYRWWQARSAGAPVDATVGTSSVTQGEGGGLAPGGNVQYAGAGDLSGPPSTPTVNSEWTALVVDRLVQQGWEGSVVQAALGLYLTSQPLTAQQETIVRAAIAVAGRPPVGTYSIIHSTAPSSKPPAQKPPVGISAPHGFRASAVTRSSATLSWQPVSGAVRYELQRQWGSRAVQDIGDTTNAYFTGLRPGGKYTVWVRAVDSDGKKSSWYGAWFQTLA